MRDHSDNPLIEVFGGSLWEANLVKGLLEANNIPSMLKDETLGAVTSSYIEFGGEVKVLVDDADLELAKKILEERDTNEAPEN